MTAAAQPACDRSIAIAAAPAPSSPEHARWILATTILASSLAFIDGSVVNVGLPAIGKSFEKSGAGLAWVLTGYLLPLSALLLLGGAAGDRYGRRRLLVAGIVVFVAGSLLCALAPGLPWLIAGRVVQGVGAALLTPNSLAILGATFSGAARGRAIGAWAAVGAGAGAVGPLLGGLLIDAIGWRAIFYINLPIAAAAIVLAWRYVPVQSEPNRAPLDAAGGALASLALGALTWGLTAWSASRQASAGATAALVLGAVAAIAFVAVERRLGGRAMLPTAVFASPAFIGLSLLTLLLYGALGALLVLVPFVLIETHGYSAAAAGAALLPLPLIIALGSTTMGRIAGRTGPRLPLTLGPLVTAIGFALCLRMDSAAGSYWSHVLPALVLMSLGMAGAVAPLTTAVLASVDAGHSGVASGFNSAVARTGGLVATALLGGVLAAHGEALAASFRAAVLVAAVAAVAAAACAWFGLGAEPARPTAPTPGA